MQKRKLGKSGIEVSEIGLGCWQQGGDFGPMGNERAQEILRAAHRSGIDFWDTADVYGKGHSEAMLEQYRYDHRPSVVVATKVGRDPRLYPDHYTKERVRANIAGSAARLGVETLDLVQLHCVPLAVLKAGDLLGWMEDFRAEGLIRAFGASVETLEEALEIVAHPGLTSLQIIFNLFRQNAIDALFPQAEANAVGIIARLPLASGVLSGKMRHGQSFAESDHRHYNSRGDDTQSYPEDSFENMQRVAREMRYPFPYLLDETQAVARAYGAVCTPDFFGYNAQLELQYRGRLDDSGRQPGAESAARELFLAMKAVAETGRGPERQVPSIGCSIKWRGSPD